MNAQEKMIIKKYAFAYMSAKGESQEKRVENLKKCIEIIKNYSSYFKNPVINWNIKSYIIRKIIPQEFKDSISFSFLNLVVKNKRLHLIEKIYDECLNILLRVKNSFRVIVYSKYPLTHYQIDSIERFFKDLFNKKPLIECYENKNCIGGYIIRWDDMIIDSTIGTKIERLKREVIKGE